VVGYQLSELRTHLKSTLGLGAVGTVETAQLDRCINAAIAQLIQNSSDDSYLDECINASIAQLINNSPDNSYLDECINAAIAQVIQNSPDDSFLDECINAAIAQLIQSSPDNSLLDECINAAIAHLIQTSLDDDTLDAAINAGIHRAASDGVPGMLRDVFIAHTYEEHTAAIASHTIDTPTVTFTPDIYDKNIYPQDIVKFSSATFLVNTLTANKVLDIGANYHTALSGSATFVRRSIKLPTAGQVVAVRIVDGVKLEPHAQNAAYAPTEEGEPRYFEQRYDSYLGVSHLVLYPAPTTSVSLAIIQNAELSDDVIPSMSDAAYDAVLERARKALLGWDDTATQIQLAAANDAVIDTSDQLKNSSNAKQGYVRQ